MDSWLLGGSAKSKDGDVKGKRRGNEEARRERILAPFKQDGELAAKPSFFPKKRRLDSNLDDAGLWTSCSSGPSHDQIRRRLLSTLELEGNPITTVQARYIRDTAVVSTSTGHQVSDKGGSGGGGGAREYWLTRHGKLAIQATEEEGVDSDILRGVVAYVNGYTGPNTTDLELKRLIHRHGGRVHYVLSQRACSHVITAMPLCAKKIHKELTRKRNGIHGAPVYVRPEWILDSVRDGKRLAEARYNILENRTMARVYDVFQADGGLKADLDVS